MSLEASDARRSRFERVAVLMAFSAFGSALLFGLVDWPCPTARLFHWPCPTCGMTRALRLAIRGDVRSATAMHPLWWLVFFVAGALVVAEVAGYARTGQSGGAARLSRSAFGQSAGLLLLAVLIAVWLARWWGAFGGPVPV